MISILFVISILFICPIIGTSSTPIKPAGCNFFGNANAVLILGASVRAEEGKHIEKEQEQRWSCTFTLERAVDERSPKIHFAVIKSSSETAAIQDFASIRVSNEKHRGFELLQGVGDEAIVHSDGQGFQLVVVRKGANSFRIKINPMTGVDFNIVKDVAKGLAAKLK